MPSDLCEPRKGHRLGQYILEMPWAISFQALKGARTWTIGFGKHGRADDLDNTTWTIELGQFILKNREN